LNEKLFGDGTGTRAVGKGKVYAGQKLGDVFNSLHVEPDFDANNFGTNNADAHVEFVHRKLADGEIYFVDNRSEQARTIDARFRVTGKAAELWYAESGTAKPASFTVAEGRTTVPLTLGPWGTVFVVFRKASSETSHAETAVTETTAATVDGPWTVAFQPDRGAPASITMNKLASWTESADEGVKYFSGSGTYTKTIEASADWFANGAKLYLDLGDVKNLAEVRVNGKDLGVVWHAPYRVDVSGVLKPGANQVEIKVVNAWVNRIIGDLQPGAKKYSFTVVHSYDAGSPLLPSGLLGPVEVVRAEAR
jgi:hypothetical protein